jgi:hypothetical protein
VVLRGEVDKLIILFTNTAILNTALRFRFNSVCSRYQALRRQWTEILRQIEAGTYVRHRFKAALHERERGPDTADDSGARAAAPDLFEAWRDARRSCGQAVENLTREKLERTLEQQRQALRERFGADAEFKFRVVVEDGRAKLKASRVKSS